MTSSAAERICLWEQVVMLRKGIFQSSRSQFFTGNSYPTADLPYK